MIRDAYRRILAIWLVFAITFTVTARQSSDQPCSFSLKDSIQSGTLVEKTSTDIINVATIEERRLLLRAFHLFPSFYFKLGPDDTNAYAVPGPPGEDNDGTVVFGVSLIQRELTRSGGTARNFSIPAIMGHEFGHLLQFKYGTTTTGVLVELQADYIAGWYLGNRRNGYQLTERDLQAALNSFYESGDYEFTSPQHHGTPDQRTAAALAGYSHSSLKFNEIYASSLEFLGASNASKPLASALGFSITDFQSVLDSIMAKRDTGFAELRGDLSPGSKSTWSAKILLPGARECSVVWRNEFQGDYECTMFETLDVDIATNEWNKLFDELKAEGWQADIDSSPIKSRLKSAAFRSTGDKEMSLDLEDKSLSTFGYRVDLTIPFDNY